MIHASELRIGSCYLYETPPIKGHRDFVKTMIDETLMGAIFGSDIDFALQDFHPIPLTEGILLKCGFVPRNENKGIGAIYDLEISDDWKLHKSVAFIHDKDNIDDIYLHFLQHPTAYKIKYLHQVQNLYFSLTNQELTCQN